ncbi:DUF488 domain-containing protein [Bifidobacterium vespertilionis]|uniref:DUF488 domain-containing protein n=1 Tax=Bifidobacterium vespertilionis TaxID=2562524 RepID=A0A5J5E0S5_9BIFI|nr:DUF488 domain-containing protein [Bifidobacterium vespertilionis]KAA8824143.1 DUF488 domain-containing protein [Bifidobacterium vespertilionis]
MGISIKRIYDEPDARDGFRILVDRLWPRGMRKERAGLDLWMRDIAPSSQLRKWFGHVPERFAEFSQRYRGELDANTEAVDELRDLVLARGTVTLLYAAKDPVTNHAAVLRDYMNANIADHAYHLFDARTPIAALCDCIRVGKGLRDAIVMRIIDPSLTVGEFQVLATPGASCRTRIPDAVGEIVANGPRHPSENDGMRIMTAAEGIAHEAWERNDPNLHAVAGYLMWICGDRGTCGLEAKAALMLDPNDQLALMVLRLLDSEEPRIMAE